MFKKDKKDNSDSDGEDDGWVPPEKVFKPPKPPSRNKAPPKPEEIKEQKMQIVIHKIGGQTELPQEEMIKLWDFGEAELPAPIISLLNDKIRQTASLGNVNALKFLVEKKADVNSQCPYTGNTALMQAVGVTHHIEKQKDVISYLMHKGADCNIKNKHGLCPKSATPGLPDNPLVVFVRELDLKVQDMKPRHTLPTLADFGPDSDEEEEKKRSQAASAVPINPAAAMAAAMKAASLK